MPAIAILALALALLASAADASCVQSDCWTTGAYQYDGAGNIRAMGAYRPAGPGLHQL